MAKAKSAKTAKTPAAAEKTTVRRIKADDSSAIKKNTSKATTTKPAAKKAPAKQTIKKPITVKTKKAETKPRRDINESTNNPLLALGNYFRGAWHELKQVRWPNRSMTWSMTLAVLLFTAVFVVMIILLDLGFNWLFKQLLG